MSMFLCLDFFLIISVFKESTSTRISLAPILPIQSDKNCFLMGNWLMRKVGPTAPTCMTSSTCMSWHQTHHQALLIKSLLSPSIWMGWLILESAWLDWAMSRRLVKHTSAWVGHYHLGQQLGMETHPECAQHHVIGRGSRWNKKERRKKPAMQAC
jgi:hypothetical protein